MSQAEGSRKIIITDFDISEEHFVCMLQDYFDKLSQQISME